MPHLSPMNWVLSISSFWLSVTMLASTLWWSDHHLFNSEMDQSSVKTPNTWNWTLQDGWD